MAASVVAPGRDFSRQNQDDTRLWSVYREIFGSVEAAIYKRDPDAVYDLEVLLRKHKPDFLSLLKNPPKNVTHREEIKNATRVGVDVVGQCGKQLFTQEFIDEALIISDLFDINEYAAVELLLAGENQLPHFPTLTRGLVAILLYYDGKRCLVNSIKTLIQARSGRTWTLGLSIELTSLTTRFTEQLIDEGLPENICNSLTEFTLVKEIDKLQKQRGLGKAKHRKLVTDQINEIRLSLAECIFNLSCQSGLSRKHTQTLLNHLSDKCETKADGTLDTVSLCLVLAALFAIDVSVIEQEDGEELINKLPIIADDDYCAHIHRIITDDDKTWQCAGVQALMKFAWAQTLRILGQHAMTDSQSDICEQDENIVESAIGSNVFQFLKDSVFTNDHFFNEEFYVRRIHGMITDFIVHMPLKVKELRNRGDEVARIIMAHIQEGLNPPTGLQRHFEQLMAMMGSLYSNDDLQLELALDYWCPTEYNVSPGFCGQLTSRPPQRKISLYKFVRSASDLLPPSLYIPYINMLTGLANGRECAHHCYNLLKTNGSNYSTQASTVSFDHFFDSFNRYLNGLRQDMPPSGERVYRYSHHRGITPQELDGLVCVLRLIRTIASKDENARIAMYDNQQWMCIYLFFGLLACSVPSILKAELLLTLASFAKTPQIASNLWQSLENSQILPTVSTTSLPPSGGIRVELDEVEARMEEYPMTLGFLDLISRLIDGPVPTALGAGTRAPGLDPYLDFLRDSIFLKVMSRAYKNPDDKWEIVSKSAEIFYKLLLQYDPQPIDCVDQSATSADMTSSESRMAANKPPGFSLMVHLLNDSRLLRMILLVIDETIDQLDEYSATYRGDESHQITGALYCLKMVALVLERQQYFISMVRESGCSILVSSMDKLLFGINPRSSRPDHHVNVGRYVCHGASHPDHALSAVNILASICRLSHTHTELVSILTADLTTATNIRHGFVQCLEADDPEPETELLEASDLETELRQSEIRHNCRLAIMELLVDVCDQQSPNLAHFLLGFNVNKPISATVLQDPGVAGSPRTCLHSVITILNRRIGSACAPPSGSVTPRLAEKAYHLLCKLCSNRDTSVAVMRYLRTTCDFFYTHVSSLPLAPPGDAMSVHALRQQAWILRTVALELRMTSLSRQRSHTQRLLTALISDDMNSTRSTIYHGGQIRSKLLLLLDLVRMEPDDTMPELPLLDFLDSRAVEQILAQCEEINQGRRVYDVRYLHTILSREVDSLQAPALASQRGQIQEECKAVLALAVQRNTVNDRLWSKRCLMDAWRQIVEIILTACPPDLLGHDKRQELIIELIQDLLVKTLDENWLNELTSSAGNVLLTLLCNLRQCFLTEPGQTDQQDQTFSQPNRNDTIRSSRTLYMSSLQVILRGLIEVILRTTGGQQGIRANLYGSMLYCIQIAQKETQIPTVKIGDDLEPLEFLNTADTDIEQLCTEYMGTIRAFGEQLIDVVCRDACDGHEIVKMLALSCLDTIISLDRSGQWLAHIQSKGYLQHLVDDLVNEDQSLQAMLKPHPEPLRSLYLYQSKMAMFCRIASSSGGAQALLRCAIMARLSECQFLDMRPELTRASNPGFDGFMPSVMERYRQLLLPSLRLSLALMTSLGIENKEASDHVLKFVSAHSDVLHTILRDQDTRPDARHLEELSLTTAVVSRAATNTNQMHSLLDNMADMETHSQFSRIQRQLMALLPKYTASGRYADQMKLTSTIEPLQSESTDTVTPSQTDMKLKILNVVANVMSYCRNMIGSVQQAKQCNIVFGPSLNDVVNKEAHAFTDSGSVCLGVDGSQPVSLGVVVLYLRYGADLFVNAVDKYKRMVHKYNHVSDLSSDELRDLSGLTSTEKVSAQHRQKLARKRLTELITNHAQEIKQSFYLIENCLFILWRHLEYYLIHCQPTDDSSTLFQHHSNQQTRIRRLQELSTSVDPSTQFSAAEQRGPSWPSKVDLDNLKLDSVSAINDALLKKLSDIEECYAKNYTHYGFMAALIRRLKRLLRLHTQIVN